MKTKWHVFWVTLYLLNALYFLFHDSLLIYLPFYAAGDSSQGRPASASGRVTAEKETIGFPPAGGYYLTVFSFTIALFSSTAIRHGAIG